MIGRLWIMAKLERGPYVTSFWKWFLGRPFWPMVSVILKGKEARDRETVDEDVERPGILVSLGC